MERAGQARKAGRAETGAGLVPLLCMAALLAFGAFFPLASRAFDSADWHGKRELFTREAERLRAVYSNCVARVEAPAEDVTIPVETFDDGAVKVAVSAKKAQYFLKEGLVWAEGVVVRRYKADGSQEACLEAKSCVVDRVAKSGWAEGPATLVHGRTVFRGEGVYFSSAEAYVKVFAASDVASQDLKFGGAL